MVSPKDRPTPNERTLETLARKHQREKLKDAKADWHFISSLDDIAWLLNLRGSDVPYNPVFLAHLLLQPS